MQAKIDIMQHHVKIFKSSFAFLFQKGFPSFWEEYGKLLSQVEYQTLLVKCRLDQNIFEDMNQSLSGKTLVDKLVVDFEIINTFRTVCSQPISYVDHVELRVLDKEMENMELSSVDQWKTIEKFRKTKYKLHQ